MTEQLRRLRLMHAAGDLSDQEFESAKASLAALPVARPAATGNERVAVDASDARSQSELDFELEQCEREWQMERRKHLHFLRRNAWPVPKPVVYAFMACLYAGVSYAYAYEWRLNHSVLTTIFVKAAIGAAVVALLFVAGIIRQIAAKQNAFARYRQRRADLTGDADLPE
jgi:hypothetical protein